MKGKRDERRARKIALDRRVNEPTDPAACNCGHAGLPAMWHMHDCPATP